MVRTSILCLAKFGVNSLRKSAWLAFVSLLLATPMSGQESISLTAYYKNFSVLLKPPQFHSTFPLPEQTDLGSVYNRFRIKMTADINQWASLAAEYDIFLRIQDPLLFKEQFFLTGVDPLSYRYTDLEKRLYPSSENKVGSVALFQNLDRLFLYLRAGRFDINIGRQAIAWGAARIINPTDIIAPFTYDQLDKEERVGVDAIRIRTPWGALGEFDAGYVFGKDGKIKHSAYYLRGKAYWLNTDLSGLLMGFRENLLLGVNFARSVSEAGAWLEAAYVFANKLKQSGWSDPENYFRLSLGMDYNLSSKIYGFLEYHYNGAGERDPAKYLSLLQQVAYRDGATYLLGKHYLTPGAIVQISPLWTLTTQGLFNLNDWSVYVGGDLEYNVAENVYLQIGAFLPLGNAPNIRLAPDNSHVFQLNSEFGSYPDMLYTAFRVYF